VNKTVIGAGIVIISVALPIIALDNMGDDNPFKDVETQTVPTVKSVYFEQFVPQFTKDIFLQNNFTEAADPAEADVLVQSTQQDENSQAIEFEPLFLLASFTNSTSNYPLTQLKTEYCAGDIFVLDTVKQFVDNKFGCTGGKTVNTVEQFVEPSLEDSFMVADIQNLTPQFKALSVDGVSFFDNPDGYTFGSEIYLNFRDSDTRTAFDEKSVVVPQVFSSEGVSRVTLTGVTAITRMTGRAADANGPAFVVEDVKSEFQSSDYVHVSNEVSFTDDCTYFATGTTNFCTKTRDFQMLTDLNVNIVELTGNHNLDVGKQAYLDTLDLFEQNGIETFGGGANPVEANTPLIVDLKDGSQVAFIGFNERCPLLECAVGENEPGANIYGSGGPAKARELITELKATNPDIFIVATVQFSEFDSYEPTSSQKTISKDLIDFGADLVMGSQAHVVQKVEFYNGKPIYYGLGNFLFDQTQSIGYRQGMILHNYFYGGKLIQTVPVFTYISNDRRPTLATQQQADAIRSAIYETDLLYGA
jgi:poly-gamma-glutamate capsule biosynthesis protein CapA/YwtB (metallophosphatase superfamily)